jgi:hypothetical protein
LFILVIACEHYFTLLVLDLTYAQLKSVVVLLRQSLQRLPEMYQRSFFSCALAMGESSLRKAELAPQYSPVTFSGVKATQCIKPETETQKQVTSVHKSGTKIQNYSLKPKNDATFLSQKTMGAANRTDEGKKNHCVKPTDLRPAASKAVTFTPRHVLSFVWQSWPVTTASLIESTKGPVKSALRKTQMKYKSDITKYMVKTQKVTLMI